MYSDGTYRAGTSRPRIVILTNYPYDGESFTGGVETATAGLLEGLQTYCDRFDFHVVALSRQVGRHTIERRGGITFHFLAIPQGLFARPHVLPNIVNAKACVRGLKPDLVHCQDNMALAIGAILAKPERKVFTVHGIKDVEARVWEGPEYWSHVMDATLERWVRRRFDEVITISPYVDRFLPIHVKKHHVPNPVRRLFFENTRTDNGTPRFLFVGSLTRLKRPMDVLRAFAIVKQTLEDATLTFAGPEEDLHYAGEMKRLIAHQCIENVRFVGAQTPDDVARLMRTSTVLVLPSVQENTPMVIAEAMAAGLPVIASRVGGVPCMITDGVDGVLFECGDIEHLAQHMTKLAEDKERRHLLACKAGQKARAMFSSDAVASSIVEVYQNLLDR